MMSGNFLRVDEGREGQEGQEGQEELIRARISQPRSGHSPRTR